MKKLTPVLFIIALIFTTSCQMVFNNKSFNNTPPLPKVFKSIYLETNINDINDCSNKTAKYLRALNDSGYAATIVVIKNRVGLHAIVKHDETYHDPTLGFIGVEALAFFGKFQFEFEYADLQDYAPEFIINEDEKEVLEQTY